MSCAVRRVTRGFALPPVTGKARVTDIVCDLSDIESARRVVAGADLIFHLGAQTSVPVSERDPLADADANVKPALNLLEASRLEGSAAIIFASTATVVGLPRQLPVSEATPFDPVTIYDLHKAIVEQYIALYARSGRVQGSALRLPNVYGPGAPSRRNDRGILNQMVKLALRGEELTVFGSGEELRDFVYVDDVVAAFLLAGLQVKSLNGKALVVATGEGRTITEAVNVVSERVARVTGIRVPVRHVTAPQLHEINRRNYVGDATLFRSVTGWKPSRTFEEGIDATIIAHQQQH